MGEQQPDIFEIKLDHEGKRHLRSVFKMAKLMFWGNIVISIMVLTYTVAPIIKFGNIAREDNALVYWAIRKYAFYSVPWVILAMIQVSFFLRFSRTANKSLENGDSAAFNYSLSWMTKSLKFSFGLLILNFIFFAYNLLFEM